MATKKKASKKKAPAKKAPARKASAKAKKAKKPAARKAMPKAKKGAKTAKSAAKSKSKAKAPAKVAAKPTGPVRPAKASLTAPKNSSSRQFSQSEFFESVRNFCGFATRQQAKQFYGDFAALIQAGLKNGYKLALPGLGKMQVRKTKARMGRNPATQEPMHIPARKKVAFTPNKALKDAVL